MLFSQSFFQSLCLKGRGEGEGEGEGQSVLTDTEKWRPNVFPLVGVGVVKAS